MFSCYRLLAAALLAVSLHAQETATLTGHLNAGRDSDPSAFVIELTHLGTRATLGRIEVGISGDFIARHVPHGEYLAKVTTLHGDMVAQQFVTVNHHTGPVELQIPARRPTPAGTTVSFRELQRPPRRQAVDAALSAQRFSESGRFDKAAVELEKAVRVSPEYAAAHSNLGVNYLRLGRYDEAIVEIRRALEIAGPNPNDLTNLGFGLLVLERFDEAAESARQALKLNRDFAPAHHVLGLVLARRPETRSEGLAHLEEAAKTLDAARRSLAALRRD